MIEFDGDKLIWEGDQIGVLIGREKKVVELHTTLADLFKAKWKLKDVLDLRSDLRAIKDELITNGRTVIDPSEDAINFLTKAGVEATWKEIESGKANVDAFDVTPKERETIVLKVGGEDEDEDEAEEEKCRKCKKAYSAFGDGFDGLCPDCADKAEAKRGKEA